ncbi:macrolide ABC transporter ATP-binding protein [Candidatus Falkowbacteria bacterium RIFOXYD2_FULL_35_9]|uniref:Macrolide ABC transporter ATP-binding protein n=1 Tax=Candidatus Falkowbacteria bacterium RIFOXYC2_FULL_36_12 TaxID=1798002 RepID=A0A1F5SZE3_9BACT|nr:MAG: macrolide ABC transporter ATP-binding protein [Candidatus Falkowbacteria bacterium RIFOXYC2_FULL_36_12]OGF33769.1 MAG: macrolide ABC transporter ATP-binding protein [Candidatus Falkowbacteria bacterium RIFOXYA2_FULL_35_8]OGF46301.1 MAG: macrolide ABC transporter ATP-binding protein [Candidatus Falkowbacteria bacterium RIFOXYD2_FULL_35_9]
MAVLIKLENLKKQYENEEIITKVLHGISFEIDEGEFVAIMGPSGSGKSTLMHILGFLDKLSSGKYFFKGKDTSNLTEDQMAGYRNFEIGFVFQAFNLLPRTSVFDNVKLPLTYANKIENIDEKVNKAIQAVGLWHRKDNLSNQLSGGEKQRVAIARALVNDPSLIFADEPTGNLDSKTGGQVMKILQDLNKQGKTIILVTHEQYTAEHAKRIFKIRDGLIEADFTVEKHREIKDGDELIK